MIRILLFNLYIICIFGQPAISAPSPAEPTATSPKSKTEATKELLVFISPEYYGYRSTEQLRKLIDEGADINAKVEIYDLTPLQMAIRVLDDPMASRSSPSRGNLNLVKILVEKGANLNVKTPDGATLLHLAAVAHNAGIVQLLIEKGADINAQDNQGKTPLQHVRKLSGLVKEPNPILIMLLTPRS